MRPKTLGIILSLALGILWGPLQAGAQQPAKTPRTGYLSPISPGVTPLLEGFRQGLGAHGYIEGQNIAVEYRWAEGKVERLPDLAAELVRLNVDVIVAGATPGALAAKKATEKIPIVFLSVGDPVGTGIVASLARPGGNITGLALFPGLQIVDKYLELLKEAIPKLSRVAVLGNAAHPTYPQAVRETEVAARALGLQHQLVGVRDPGEFENAFLAMTRERAGAVVVLPDTMFLVHRARITELVAKHRLPWIHGLREHVEAGGLMSYGTDLRDLGRRAATFVDKILKGARPADLPVEQPTKFRLVVNLKIAKAFGLTIPQSVLLRADEVVQ